MSLLLPLEGNSSLQNEHTDCALVLTHDIQAFAALPLLMPVWIDKHSCVHNL